MLISDLCDYNDAYIVVEAKIIVTNPDNDAYNKKLALKKNAPFTIMEDLDVIMPMYNLIEYSKNYLKTSGSLWNYYRDEPNSGAEGV